MTPYNIHIGPSESNLILDNKCSHQINHQVYDVIVPIAIVINSPYVWIVD